MSAPARTHAQVEKAFTFLKTLTLKFGKAKPESTIIGMMLFECSEISPAAIESIVDGYFLKYSPVCAPGRIGTLELNELPFEEFVSMHESCVQILSMYLGESSHPDLRTRMYQRAWRFLSCHMNDVIGGTLTLFTIRLLRTFLVRVYTEEQGTSTGTNEVKRTVATRASQLLYSKAPTEYVKLVEALHAGVCSACDASKTVTHWFRGMALPASEDPRTTTKFICDLYGALRRGGFPGPF